MEETFTPSLRFLCKPTRDSIYYLFFDIKFETPIFNVFVVILYPIMPWDTGLRRVGTLWTRLRATVPVSSLIQLFLKQQTLT